MFAQLGLDHLCSLLFHTHKNAAAHRTSTPPLSPITKSALDIFVWCLQHVWHLFFILRQFVCFLFFFSVQSLLHFINPPTRLWWILRSISSCFLTSPHLDWAFTSQEKILWGKSRCSYLHICVLTLSLSGECPEILLGSVCVSESS